MSINLKDYINKKANIYLKVIVDDKIKPLNDINLNPNNENNNNKLRHYEIPGINNFDYKSQTDNYLGVMNINIENIPVIKEEDKAKKIVRALFVITIINNYFNAKEGLQNIENLDDNSYNNYARYKNSE